MYKSEEDAKEYLRYLVESGKAVEKFRELILAQYGNPDVVDNYDLFALPKYKVECEAKKGGYVHNIDAYKIAYGCKMLGAGRETKSDPIDYSVGVFLNKKSGETVNRGDILYTIYSNDAEKTKIAQKYCEDAYTINDEKPAQKDMIYKIIRAEEV